jgi:signal transduction histidine kinase
LQSNAPADTKERKIRIFVETSKRQIDTLTRLVETLLDVSRIRLGGLSLALEDGVDLAEIVHDAVERLRPQWEAAQSPVTVACPDPPPQGRWDRLRLGQLLANLLGNAIKYGRGRPIEIAVAAREGGVEVSIRDHGVGISGEDQARIFNRFERASSIRTFGGLGLGLYISRQIVAAHGGAIHVESAVGEGSTFTVDLPLRAPERAPLAAEAEKSAAA